MPKVKYRRLTEDEEKFIKRYAAGHSREEITNALNKKFQTDVPKWKVEYFLSDNKITTGYTTGHKYSKDEICFLEAYAPSHSLNEIQIAFNDKLEFSGGKKFMRLVEVTPENDYWNKQKVLYAYDTDRVATLFDESTENEKIYGYQFLNRDVQELIDDDIHSWEDAERVFLETITDLLDDEAKYYDELKNMCKELIS